MPAPSTVFYVAVRKTEGREWIDASTLSAARDGAAMRCAEVDRVIHDWSKANPVVRIVAVRLVEEE